MIYEQDNLNYLGDTGLHPDIGLHIILNQYKKEYTHDHQMVNQGLVTDEIIIVNADIQE